MDVRSSFERADGQWASYFRWRIQHAKWVLHIVSIKKLNLQSGNWDFITEKWQDDPDSDLFWSKFKTSTYLYRTVELTFIILARENDESLSANNMAGDINLFLKGRPEDDEFEAEVEIMIAGILWSPELTARGVTFLQNRLTAARGSHWRPSASC